MKVFNIYLPRLIFRDQLGEGSSEKLCEKSWGLGGTQGLLVLNLQLVESLPPCLVGLSELRGLLT